MRYARALTRDEVAAEDLVQDALLIACQKRARFEAGRSLRAWLFAILHNRFIDDRRRLKVEQSRDRRLAEAEAMVPRQEQSLRLVRLDRAFAALPRDQRIVLRLVAMDGLSYREAAALLDIPVGTVMSRLSRARAALRASESPFAPAFAPLPAH